MSSPIEKNTVVVAETELAEIFETPVEEGIHMADAAEQAEWEPCSCDCINGACCMASILPCLYIFNEQKKMEADGIDVSGLKICPFAPFLTYVGLPGLGYVLWQSSVGKLLNLKDPSCVQKWICTCCYFPCAAVAIRKTIDRELKKKKEAGGAEVVGAPVSAV